MQGGERIGSIKTSVIKRFAAQLYEKYGDRFTLDWEENKRIVDSLAEGLSKNTRNQVAGYITTLKRRENKKEVNEDRRSDSGPDNPV